MALIGKLREKSGLAIGLVAAGLILFILGGDLLSPSSVIRGTNNQIVGEIAGEDVPVALFEKELNELRYVYYLNTNKIPGQDEINQFLPQAWSQLIFKTAFQKEFDKLGLVVPDEEVIDMVQGKNLHPAIVQSFRNPQTGEFDVNFVRNYLQNLSRVDEKQRAAWFNFEKNLGPDRLRTKYENLLKKTVYITTEEAKREFFAQNAKVDLKYVLAPYSSIPDQELGLTDDDVQDYAKSKKHIFPTEASFNLEYVTFPIIPSKEDSVNFVTELEEIKRDFKTTDDDSLFVALNSDNPSIPRWMSPGEIPQPLQNASVLKKDSVYGPIVENNTYYLFKISDYKADTNSYSARASHILFRWNSETPEDKKKALDKAKEVLARINKGESFETLAKEYGTDGTASQGGDLGWFTKGRMVKEFENAVFSFNKKGVLPQPVETQFGYHLIKVTEPKTNKLYFISSIEKTVQAGDATRDSVYKIAETFAINSGDRSGFNLELQKNPNFKRLYAPNVLASSQYINNLKNPKEIIRWAFLEAKVDESISPVFEIDNQYIVCLVTGKYKDGEVNVESNRQYIAFHLITDKKAEKLKEKIGTNYSTLEEVAKLTGEGIEVKESNQSALSSSNLSGLGYEPAAVGAAFGLKEGKLSKPLKGNNGVIVVQNVKKYDVAEIADYSQYKNIVANLTGGKNDYNITQAIVDKAKIKDYRYKFY
jgi:peptidyl-prolyl cis-trans isomerase D